MTDEGAPGREKSREWEFDETTSPSQPPCAFCLIPIDSAPRKACPRCQAVYHPDCWTENEGRCAVYGCLPVVLPKEAPRPVSGWVVGGGVLLLLLVAIGLLAILGVGTPPGFHGVQFGLTSLARAQSNFWSADPAGTGQHAYWRKDIAGLYALPGEGGRPIRLIPLEGALADARPSNDHPLLGLGAPLHGYWFRAILHADETEPDPNRFAACAFPEKYRVTGLNTFIVSERAIVFKKDLGHGDGVERFPADPAQEGWRRLDE